MSRVAVLYIDPRGPYPAMPDVDCWDVERDARKYAGPHPIVAHPPCGPWSRMRHLCKYQDKTLAPDALEKLRHWGGVLEHPAHSQLWKSFGLPLPGGLPHGDTWAMAVDQVRWGHVARKATWLLFVGVPRNAVGTLPPDREATHWIAAPARVRRNHPGKKACSAAQARRTPPAFARWLVDLAATATSPGPESPEPSPA